MKTDIFIGRADVTCVVIGLVICLIIFGVQIRKIQAHQDLLEQSQSDLDIKIEDLGQLVGYQYSVGRTVKPHWRKPCVGYKMINCD